MQLVQDSFKVILWINSLGFWDSLHHNGIQLCLEQVNIYYTSPPPFKKGNMGQNDQTPSLHQAPLVQAGLQGSGGGRDETNAYTPFNPLGRAGIETGRNRSI